MFLENKELVPDPASLGPMVGCGRGRGWLWVLQTRHTCNQSLLIIHPIKPGLSTTSVPDYSLLNEPPGDSPLNNTSWFHPGSSSQHPADPTCSCVHINKLCSSFNYFPVCFGVRT
ncbi:unnamed protein product [Pleuronectes platessa]|uniref:Uncharacterized protein n=1 Tax=Pleuronectes platessa TaxID=8262 RepID=A0A9N7YLK2_PLEPL|nr:unnamed protein product [Pleuronectes platessa]